MARFVPPLMLCLSFAWPAVASSTCYGTVAKGRLEGAVALPPAGPNFSPYSSLGEATGRTYVHSMVRDIVVGAYRELEKAAPGKHFVYGETGWKDGGRIRPHKTHQNGLSVDFMVPVLDNAGRSIPLPGNAANRFGYGIEFDAGGRFDGLRIDFDAIGEHLYQLDRHSRVAGSGLQLVIFDTAYLPRLFRTARGQHLQRNVKFMTTKPWVRHDEHYHVDFVAKCKPYAG